MNAIILQCGGPTPVINASLAAVVEATQSRVPVGKLWGIRCGFHGLRNWNAVDLTEMSTDDLELLRHQPAAALGSGRDMLTDEDLRDVTASLAARNIDTAFLIGGNGTMAGARLLSQAARNGGKNPLLRVIGIPKTIDNDLPGTDVCPGYGSAARYIAHAVRDAALDLYSMRNFDDVVIFETMGRYTGWIAAASALARWNIDSAPHLILLPEIPLDERHFVDRVRQQIENIGTCFVVVAEGVRDSSGEYLAEKGKPTSMDSAGQKLLSLAAGPAAYLATVIRLGLNVRCRIIRPDTLQRSTSVLVSEVDEQLARMAGLAAVASAQQELHHCMISLRKHGTQWDSCTVSLTELTTCKREVPSEFIDKDNYSVTNAFIDYVKEFVEPIANTPMLL